LNLNPQLAGFLTPSVSGLERYAVLSRYSSIAIIVNDLVFNKYKSILSTSDGPRPAVKHDVHPRHWWGFPVVLASRIYEENISRKLHGS
jgi:hypothetical protein